MVNSAMFTDNKLVRLAKENNQSAFVLLLTRFTPVIRSKCKKFYSSGLESEDFFQEGALGLFYAVKNYNADCSASFYTYASVCIENSLISAYKAASRKKHIPLENYISLNEISSSEVESTLTGISPEERYIELENLKNLNKFFSNILSEKEYKVLGLYLQGYSYCKIAEMLNINKKSVDNTISRVKKKVKNSDFDK